MIPFPVSSPTPPRPTGKTAPTWRRRLPLYGGLLLVGLIVIGLWPRAIPVESGMVVRGPLVVTVDEEGMTRVKNRYVVSAPIAGQLRRIDWKAGAPVEAGKTVLATLESSGADFLDARSLAQAEAHVRAAEANRDAAAAQRDRASAAAKLAEAEFERARQLREQKVASAQEYDLAQMRTETAAQDARAAVFGLKVAEFELEQARALLTRGKPPADSPNASPADLPPLVITSPVDGKILRVFQESARVVVAGFPLMEVGDPTDLEVRIEVLSRDGVAIRPGARVILERWGGDEPLNARVRLVEPSAFTKISALGVEEQRVYVIADFTDPIEKRATLGDSYRVEARVVTWEKPDTLHAPAGALFQRDRAWQTFVIEGGRARLRTVKIGRSNGIETEILEGIKEGDRLVVYPGDKVFNGTRVTPLVIDAR
jgi:HlyD family secretion protein